MSTIVTPVNIEQRKGRKRRPSHNLEDIEDPVMDDCMAAMVLMSLSCSPKSTFIPDRDIYSMSVKSIDSGLGSAASRSTTPSPTTTINEDSTASSIAIEINKIDESTIIVNKDEGIDMDETIDFIIDDPIKTNAEKARRIVFKCTWRGCGLRCDLVEEIEKHVRIVHLGRSEVAGEEENDHEEEFYYAEIEEEMEIDNISNIESSCSSDSSLGPLSPVSSSPESPVNSTNYHNLSPTLSPTSLLFFAPSPTWSHLDMARPPHEDPEYQKQQKQLQLQQQQQQQANQKVQNVQTSVTQTILSAQSKPEPERKTVISSPINIPGISVAHRWSTKVHHRDSSAASSSSSSPSLSTSCNSSCSFSNFHHNHPNHQNHHHHPHLHHHHHPHFYHHHEHQSQTSLLGSSPSSFFSPKAPSKVMRLSCKSSSPININNKSTTSINATNSLHRAPTRTPSPLAMAGSINNTTAKLISSSNTNTISANTAKNGSSNNNINNQWTSLLQSSTSSASSTSSSLSSSSSSSSASSFISSVSSASSSASSSFSSSPSTTTTTTKGHSISPSRRSRTETRKCRKVYGMDNRDSWCTQCKWKKACTRFVD